MRSRSTIEFLGLWEQLNNPDFKGVEFDSFIREAGSNAFTLSPQKWISTTNAIGVISKSGDMAELLPIRKLLSSLHLGFQLNSRCTLSRIISV
jgi:hypothetical protein